MLQDTGSPFSQRQIDRFRRSSRKSISFFLLKSVRIKDHNSELGLDLETILRKMNEVYGDWNSESRMRELTLAEKRDFVASAIALSRYFGFLARFRDRVMWGQRALEIAEVIEDERSIVELCASTISWPLLQMGDLAEAEKYSKKGYELAIAAHMWREAGLAARTLSGISRDRAGAQPFDNSALILDAVKWAKDAYQCGARSKNRDLRLSAIFDLANAAMIAGQWRRAERCYRVIVGDMERNPVANAERLTSRLGDLAHALMCQGRVSEAKTFYDRSARLLETFDSPIIKAELDFNLAAVARLNNQPELERELFQQGRDAFVVLGIERDSRIDMYLKIAAAKRMSASG